MRSIFKSPLFYLNLFLLVLVVLLAGQSNLWQKAQAAVNYITSTTGGTINYLVSFVGAANPTYQVGSSIIYDSGQGKIGIGTVSPGAQLDVNGIAITGGQTLSLGGGSNLANEKLRLFYDSTNNTNYLAGKTGTSLQLGSGNDNVLLLQEGTVIYNALAKLNVADFFTATIRAANLELGYSRRRGNPGRALVDFNPRLIINYGGDWSQGVEVQSDFFVRGTAYATDFCLPDGFCLSMARPSAPPAPPVFYSKTCPDDDGTPVYCDSGDTRITCTDTGHGKNHWITLVAPNGCSASEGPANYGGGGCSLSCSHP